MNLTTEQKISLARLAGLKVEYHDGVKLYSIDDAPVRMFLNDRSDKFWNDIQLIKEGIKSRSYHIKTEICSEFIHVYIGVKPEQKFDFGLIEISSCYYKTNEAESILIAALKLCEHLKI